LDGAVLISLAPATANGDLPCDRVEFFHVPRGTIVTLRPEARLRIKPTWSMC
jgi:hypothetical protein